MALTVPRVQPIAHWPLVLGVLRRRHVATLLEDMLPPHPAHVLSCGHGGEALLLAILDGHQALYQGGRRLAERGMLPLLPKGLPRLSLKDYRLGQSWAALFAANLTQVFGAVALKALEVYAISPPWLQQEPTTIALYGAYAGEAPPDMQRTPDEEAPGPPRPTYGPRKDGRDALQQVLRRLGGSGDGGLPLRVGSRDGNTRESIDPPRAIEEYLTLGRAGVRGIVAESKGYSQRPIGLCLEKGGAG